MRKIIVTAAIFLTMVSAPKVFAEEGEDAAPLQIELNSETEMTSEWYLRAGSISEEDMAVNTQNLQAAVDFVSDSGGGKIVLPVGTFYFAAYENNYDGFSTSANDREWHVIECRDQVEICGNLREDGSPAVTLIPVSEKDKPTDMFYFANLIETGESIYLNNADFKNLVIDCSEAVNTGRYTAKGKGFYFVLLKNCDWENVTVRGSDGTGFGVDCPVECTMTSCTAIQCGKQASVNDIGASGFGIGYGYSPDESIVIRSCGAYGNRKYGFFFENQKRFRPDLFLYETSKQFLVQNCLAAGNLYNYGGETCCNLTYDNCENIVFDTSLAALFETATEKEYHFSGECGNCRIILPETESVTEENSAMHKGTDYSSVYDYEYYISRYQDLRNAFGDDREKAFQHFLTYGMKEGRQAAAGFCVKYYRENYTDLQTAFGNDLKRYYLHYLEYGKKENRCADAVIPKAGGLNYSDIYNWQYYMERYPDLSAAFGDDQIALFHHFLKYGMKEGRQAIETFDVRYYKNRYPDLQRVFGNDMKRYYIHYLQYGKKEHRKTCEQEAPA